MAAYDDPEAVDDAGRAAMWTYIWVMVGFKIVTAAFLLWYTHAFYTVAVLLALHIPWMVGALVLVAVPGAFWFRLIKVRARRAELIRQEFEVAPPAEPLPAAV